MIKTPHVGSSLIMRPSKLKGDMLALSAFWMVSSCWATTDNTCREQKGRGDD